MRIPHQIYYLIELIILAVGFFVLYSLSYDLRLQTIVLTGILLFYAVTGIAHHKIHHDLHKKIVIEYILISLLVLAIFLFLNMGKV